MEEIKETPIILTYGPEAGNVCWSAMTDSIKRSIERHNKNLLELSDVTGSYNPPVRKTTPRAPHKRRKSSWRTSLYSQTSNCQSTKPDDWTISYRPKLIPMNGDLSADSDESDLQIIDSVNVKFESFNNNNDDENFDGNKWKIKLSKIDLDQQQPKECKMQCSDVLVGGCTNVDNQMEPPTTLQSSAMVIVKTTPEKTLMDKILEQDDGDQSDHCLNLSDDKPLSKYEQKITEVDRNIVSFSLSFLFFTLFIVLFHIVF